MNSRGALPIIAALAVAASTLFSSGADWPQWRGPTRDGISKESGLLKQWPEGGPKLLWRQSGIGSGYATPAIVGETLFLLGNEGVEDEFVAARRAKDGSRIWQTRIGKVGKPQQNPSFPGARSTPTIDGGFLYALGSDGDLACLERDTGKIVWQKNLQTEFGGRPGEWAYSESPLIDGNRLICAPAGPGATVVALNKENGNLLWKTKVEGVEQAAFASAIRFEVEGAPQYVHLLQRGLVGIDPGSGKLLWHYAKPVSRYGANIPSPTAREAIVYVASAGTGGGAVRIRKKADGFEAEELYFEAKMPTAIGGTVVVGNHIYGTTAQAMMCIELMSGDIKWQERALGAASICFADGRLYLHSENGEVALVEPSVDGYLERGRFSPPERPQRISPMEKAWAYPVVAGGRLYLRDHGTLWCYDVRQN